MQVTGKRLAGKVAIVTGAGSGIGRAIATAFVAESAHVIAIDRDAASLQDAARAFGDTSLSLPADATDAVAMSDAVTRAVDRFGRLTTVVAAAGISFGKRLTDSETHEWEATFAVNVVAAFKLLKPAIPA